MRYVTIKRNNSYSRNKFSDFNMVTIADWFTDDVGTSFESWIDWLNDDTLPEETESNATWLEKFNDKIALISITDIIHHEPNPVPKNEISYISKSNLIELLKQWDLLTKNRSQQIIIIEENGVYRMEEVQ